MTTNKSKTPPKNDIKFSISLSAEQKIAKSKILTTPFNFILGKAGSGKTLLAVQVALDKYFKREIDKIIITRPTVIFCSADNDIENFISFFGGRTFDNCVCIVDEFQNLTKQQLQMVLSRLGKGSTMILCGDRYQIDLKFRNDSAIHDVPKIKESKYVNETILTDNHRHESLEEILNLLNEKY